MFTLYEVVCNAAMCVLPEVRDTHTLYLYILYSMTDSICFTLSESFTYSKQHSIDTHWSIV